MSPWGPAQAHFPQGSSTEDRTAGELGTVSAQIPWGIPGLGGRVRGVGEDLVFRPHPLWEGSWDRHLTPGPLPTADRRGGTDGQPAAPPLRPHREAATQAASCLQHPLPVQGPRSAANVRGECVRGPHPRPRHRAQVPQWLPWAPCPLPPGPALTCACGVGGRDEGGPPPLPPVLGLHRVPLRPRPVPTRLLIHCHIPARALSSPEGSWGGSPAFCLAQQPPSPALRWACPQAPGMGPRSTHSHWKPVPGFGPGLSGAVPRFCTAGFRAAAGRL